MLYLYLNILIAKTIEILCCLIKAPVAIESRKGFHPHVLTEPCLRLSPHTALLVYKSQGNKTLGMYQLPMWK